MKTSLTAFLPSLLAFAAVAEVGPLAREVREDGTVITVNQSDREIRMADSYVLAPHAKRIDYSKKKGRENTYDAGKGDKMPWVVSEEDKARFAELGRRTPLARPVRPRKVLVVAKALGFSHTESLVWGTEAIRCAAKATGFADVEISDEVATLEDEARLSKYDAIVLNNVTSVSTNRFPKLEAVVTRYVENGGGLCLIHSAVDSFNDSPGMRCLCGGHFFGHPWFYTGLWAFRNECEDSPVMRTMPKGVSHYSDEIYQQETPPFSRTACKVLLSLDMTDPATKAAAHDWAAAEIGKRFPIRADGDTPVSWTKSVGKGRVFYTSFGHDARAFFDPDRFGHILLGLQHCIGD